MENEYTVLAGVLRIIGLICGVVSFVCGLIAISNTKANYKFYPLVPIWPFMPEWFTDFGNASRINCLRFGAATGIVWLIAWAIDGR